MTEKYFCGILTYFKNEKNNLNEWILHYKSVGIEVQEYKDLGTWEEIRKLLSNHKEDNGG